MTVMDFIGAYDPLTLLKSTGFKSGLEWDICVLTEEVIDGKGLRLAPNRRGRGALRV